MPIATGLLTTPNRCEDQAHPPYPRYAHRRVDGVLEDDPAYCHCGSVSEPLDLLALYSPRVTQPRQHRRCTNHDERVHERLDRLGGVRQSLDPKRILEGARENQTGR